MKNWYCSGQELAAQVRNTPARSDMAALWYIGQCGYIIKYKTTVLMIDPVLGDIVEDGQSRRLYAPPFAPDALEPDFVICTHAHIDHMAPETVQAIAARYPHTHFVLPAGCMALAQELGLQECLPMVDGQTRMLTNSIRIQALSAAHPTHVDDPEDTNMALGYCLEMGNIRIVHLGDTYLTERLLHSLEALGTPSIFLPPINGDDRFRAMRSCIGNLEAEEAAKLAAHLGADLTMPTHFDMIQNNTVDPLRFAAELMRIRPQAKWHIPALGEKVTYEK